MQPTAVQFSLAARTLAVEARRLGLAAPGFRSPPRLPGCDRAIRRWPDGGAVVAVRLRERPFAAVVADMVEGVLVANGVPPERRLRLRHRLLAAVGTVAHAA